LRGHRINRWPSFFWVVRAACRTTPTVQVHPEVSETFEKEEKLNLPPYKMGEVFF